MDHQTLTPPLRLYTRFCRAVIRLIGWRLAGEQPAYAKYIMVGAPHTSNLDFLLFLLLVGGHQVQAKWVGKDTLFRGPLGGLATRLGGIPVNRRSSNGFVQQMIAAFTSHPELVVAIAPEGTRSHTSSWKTGFYYIAVGARVPIALGFIDNQRKELGFGPTITPSGDIEVDFELIRLFYQEKVGLKPARQGIVQLRSAT